MKARPQIPGAHWASVGLGVTLAWASCVVGPILYAHSPSTSSSWQLAPAGLLALYLLKLWLERKRADTFSLLLFRSDGLTSPLLRGLFYPLLIGGASVLLYQSALPSISHLHSIELSSQHPAFIQLRVSDLPANDTLSLRAVSSPLSIAGEFLAPFLACVLWPLIVSKLAWAVLQQYRSFLRDTETMRVARYIDVLYLDQPGSTSCRDFANGVAVPDGYVKCVLPIDDYDPVNMLRKATILLVVVDPQRFQDNRLLRWLRVERLQRDKEAIEKGPTANIVYTKEGDRRRAFLTVKFGVIPQSSSTSSSSSSSSTTSTTSTTTSQQQQQQEKEQTPHPAYTLPVLLHTYLTEFGAMPLNALDLSEGVPKATVEDVWSRLDESADRESAEPHLSLKLFWEYLRSCQTCGVHTGICRSRERVHHLTPTLGTWLRAYCNPAVRSRLWEFHAALWNPLNYTVVSGLVALLLLYAVYWPFATDDEGESVSLAAAWFLWTAAVLLGNRLLEVARQTPPVVHNKGHFEEAVAKEQQGKLYSPPPDSLRLADLKVSFDLPATTDQSEARQLVEQAPQQLAVSKLFCFSAQGFALPESSHYSAAEHLKSAVQTEPTILVRDQDILVEYFFTLSASDLANGRALLTSLQPGQSLSKLDALKLCPDQRLLASLLSAGVLGPERPVAVKRWNMKELRASFNSDGYVLLPKFLPPHAFSQFQQYYRSVMEGYGGRSAADAYNLHFYFWNDEPLGRYYNHQLTQFFQKLLKRPLLHPGLAMGIWIMPGEGCPLHQDTSPPFDLTWDICIDHAGSCPRPLTFLFPSGPKEINLHPNDSILFNGGVLPHVCGSLSSSPVNMHNVFLATWTYA